jgi:FdhD protein
VPVRHPSAGAIAEVELQRLRAGRLERVRDRLAVEAPLELRLSGVPRVVLLRTPGADEELAAGFLVGEGVITAAADLVAVGRPPAPLAEERANVLDLELAPGCAERWGERATAASSACGACGKTSIAALAVAAPPVGAGFVVAAATVERLPERLRAAQPGFAATGGLHAAALFDGAGELVAVREDVGRHNAVDKLVGWALGEGRLPLSGLGLVVSGRLGYEIVQKAIVAGLPLVVAVGAASSLAVDLALRYGQTLATFVRPGGFNVHGDATRLGL